MEITERPLSEIKPYPKNAKDHPEKQIKKIANSIKEFGFNQPIVLDKDNVIIVGHGRYIAAQTLGMETVPTLTVELDEERAKSYRLADNKLNESDWDMDIVIAELKGLSLDMIDLTGFDKDLLIELDEKDDVVPEKAPSISMLGDIYKLGNHRVMCGDSTKKEDVEKLMEGEKADMVFTDPPYGVNVGEKLGGRHIKGDDSVESAKIIYEEVFKRIYENIKKGAIYYVCSPQGGDMEMMMMMMMMRSTIPCKHQLIWKKDSPVFSMGRLDYDYQHEPILYGWFGSHKHIGGGKFKSSVWEIPRPKASKLHPTMKPVELVVEAILNSTKEGDVVIDYFLGSGSTLIAVEKTGRICYGMEIEPKYVDVVVKRWEDYTKKKAEKWVA